MVTLGQGALPDLVRRLSDVPGWLSATDSWLLSEVSRQQVDLGTSGDLLEIGVFAGKSAVLIESLRQPGERLVVCDLFETPADSGSNRVENAQQYEGLARRSFEETFLRFHPELPEIHHCRSDQLQGRLAPDAFRLQHVDGSHLFDIVRSDLRLAESLAVPDGVVVMDDYRAPHTPGVAAAAWEAVSQARLHPFCLSQQKMYAAVGRSVAAGHRERLTRSAAEVGIGHEVQHLFGADVLRVWAPEPSRRERLTASARRRYRAALRTDPQDLAVPHALARLVRRASSERGR